MLLVLKILVVLGLMLTRNVEMTSSISAVINSPFTIQSQNTCNDGGWEHKNEAHKVPHRVVTDLHGRCEFGEDFRNRVKTRDNKLTIERVKVEDEGVYIHKCNYGRTWKSDPVKIDPQRSTVEVGYGGSLPIDLCSSDQVKLTFTQRGSSSAPETRFIIDSGQAFCHLVAGRDIVKLNFTQRGGSSAPETHLIIDSGQAFCHLVAGRGTNVTVHNNTAVLSNLVQDGTITVIHSNTGKMLHEVNFTVPRSAHRQTTTGTSLLDTIDMVPPSGIGLTQGQVKLKFALSDRSTPDTLLIIDNGQVFYDCTAFGGFGTSALHNTTMLSNLMLKGECTIIDSKTETVLSHLFCTVTLPDRVADYNISKDHNWFPAWGWLIVSLLAILILAILYRKFLNKHLRQWFSHEAQDDSQKSTFYATPPRRTSSVSLHPKTNV